MEGKIGLEIHTYLITDEKLFCKCLASREKGICPNTNICPICTGQPGSKPLPPNQEAIKKAIMIGLALNCKINKRMHWQRKHYDWPDLPKGYQTTISGSGAVPLGINGMFKDIRINSMHLEEDPASWDPSSGCVDYNRSGLPLVEIVTEPDFKKSEEVVEWLKSMIQVLNYLRAVDRNAGVKVDVNVNIPGKTERVEIKNINSFEDITRAIEYELERQTKEGSIRETRRFDSLEGKTIHMRSKENQEDYRFISDPDLNEIVFSEKYIDEIKKNLPEMPDIKLKKLIKKYNIDKKNAEILSKDIDIVEFFEKVADKVDGKFSLPWVSIELLRILNWNKKELSEVDINPDHFAELLNMVRGGKITELQAKQVLNKFIPKSFDPSKTESKINDRKEIRKIIDAIIRDNKKVVKEYKKGDEKILNYFMGEIMKKTNRRADFKIAREILLETL